MKEPVDALESVIANSNPVFGIEVRGFDHIPEPERNMTLRQVDLLWVGTNANLLNFAIGALAVTYGLNFWAAIAACFIGNLPFVYLGLGSIGAVRAGLPVSTLSRAVFGVRGNLPNAFLAWLGSVAFEVISTIFGVYALLALFPLLGWDQPGGWGKIVAVVVQLLLGGGIAVLGHATMVYVQRIFAVLLSAALLLVVVCSAGKIDWVAAGTAHPALATTNRLATFVAAVAVIGDGAISFLFNGPDWVRYLPSATPARRIFHHVFWSGYLSTVAMCVLGALWATQGDMADPVAGLKPFIPDWLFIVYILAVVGGALANNVPVYYSSGLSMQALGLKVHRSVATMLDIAVSTAIVLYILFVEDFSTALNDFLGLEVAWVGPYAGVWICDGFLRGWKIDHRAIHRPDDAAGRYWGWRGINLRGWTALAVGMAAAALTLQTPVYTGPVATMLGGADLNWIVGLLVSAGVYRLLYTAGAT
jgi:purine-cytosine permease-like protein